MIHLSSAMIRARFIFFSLVVACRRTNLALRKSRENKKEEDDQGEGEKVQY